MIKLYKKQLLYLSNIFSKYKYSSGKIPSHVSSTGSVRAYFAKSGIGATSNVNYIKHFDAAELLNSKVTLEPKDKKYQTQFPQKRIQQPLLEYNVSNAKFYKNAFFSDDNEFLGDLSYVYLRNFNETSPWNHPVFSSRKPSVSLELKGQSLSTLCPNGDTYYHWLVDSISRLANAYSLDNNLDDYNHILVPGSETRFKKQFYDELGISKKIIYINESTLLNIQNVVAYNSPRWCVPDYQLKHMGQLLASISNDVNFSQKLSYNAFICRKPETGRSIENHNEVKSFLEKRNYKTFYMEDLNLKQQASVFRSAKNIVAVHGSSQANLFYSKKKTGNLIELFGNRFINPCYYYLASRMGWNYGAVIGHSKKTFGHGMDAPFTICLKNLENTLEELETPQ